METGINSSNGSQTIPNPNKLKQALVCIELDYENSVVQFYDTRSNTMVDKLELDADLHQLDGLEVFKNPGMAFINTAKSTLVPATFFEKEKSTVFLESVYGKRTPNYAVKSVYVEAYDCYNVFESYPETEALLLQNFPAVQIKHALGLFIESTMHPVPEGTRVHLRVKDQQAQIAITIDQKLEMANQFQFQNSEELLYFVGNVLQQNDINQSTPIDLILESKHEVETALGKYYKKVYRKNAPIEAPEGKLIEFIPTCG